MVRFWGFERMDKNLWQSMCPDGGSPSHRIPSGGKMEICPWSMKSTKKHTSCCTDGVCRKTEDRKSEALPHSLLMASGPPMSPQHPQCEGPQSAPAPQLYTRPTVLPEQQWNSTFLLNIHRILFFSTHISMSTSTSKIAENIDTGCQSGLQNCPQKNHRISIKSITCFFTCTAIILQAFTSVILNFI